MEPFTAIAGDTAYCMVIEQQESRMTSAVLLRFPLGAGGDMGSNQEEKRIREDAKALVKEAVRELLNERDALDHDRHHADHEFVKILRERQQRRLARWEQVKTSVTGSVILAILGGIVSFLFWVGNLWLSSRGQNLGPPGH